MEDDRTGTSTSKSPDANCSHTFGEYQWSTASSGPTAKLWHSVWEKFDPPNDSAPSWGVSHRAQASVESQASRGNSLAGAED